ncbi:MAG TPA: hypothetical protein PKY19_07370, partial [Oscillospiraceae bacterium]|nr:hypothetical protein [Oscillospiraceae bacterium]
HHRVPDELNRRKKDFSGPSCRKRTAFSFGSTSLSGPDSVDETGFSIYNIKEKHSYFYYRMKKAQDAHSIIFKDGTT